MMSQGRSSNLGVVFRARTTDGGGNHIQRRETKIPSLSARDREADEINTHERRRAVGQTGRVRMELQCMKSRADFTSHWTAEDHTKPHDLR